MQKLKITHFIYHVLYISGLESGLTAANKQSHIW